jgi:hypothetical protein
MKVAMIWDADYPWDVRIEKVACTLMEAGHTVHLICRNTKNDEARESLNGLHIHRLPPMTKVLSWLAAPTSFPAFFNPIWLWHIWKVARGTKADVILVRDLPLCPAAIFVTALLRKPCVLDMAECYPEMVRCTWKFEGFKLKNAFLRNPFLGGFQDSWHPIHYAA